MQWILRITDRKEEKSTTSSHMSLEVLAQVAYDDYKYLIVCTIAATKAKVLS